MVDAESSPPARPPRGRSRRALRWAIELSLLCAAFIAINAWQTRDLPRGELPRFALRAIDGGTLGSGELVGEPVIVLFWAPWCGVCGAQSQNVSWLQRLAGHRARVISVATSYRSQAEVRTYMTAHDVDYPVLLGDAALARRFGVRAFPTAFFVDAEGQIVRSVTGYTTTLGLLWRTLLL